MKKYFLNVFRKIVGIEKVMVRQELALEKISVLENKVDEIYKAILFNNTIEDSKWLTDKAFSPGRMAVDYSFLYTLYRILNEIRPKKIVEFGVGQTTKMISQYCEVHKSEAFTFEHDENWLMFFNNSFMISEKIKIVLSELEEIQFNGELTTRYKGDLADITGNNIDLVIIDGPTKGAKYSRVEILDLIPEAINRGNYCILLDDYQRNGEKETSKLLIQKLEDNNIAFKKAVYSGEKEHLLLCSPNNSFLLTL